MEPTLLIQAMVEHSAILTDVTRGVTFLLTSGAASVAVVASVARRVGLRHADKVEVGFILEARRASLVAREAAAVSSAASLVDAVELAARRCDAVSTLNTSKTKRTMRVRYTTAANLSAMKFANLAVVAAAEDKSDLADAYYGISQKFQSAALRA
jgi:hypothetical protein